MQAFVTILILLNQPTGAGLYFLLTLLCIEVILETARRERQHLHLRETSDLVTGFTLLFLTQGFLLLLEILGVWGEATFLALVRGLELAGRVALVWGFVASLWPEERQARRVLLLSFLAVGAGVAMLLLPASRGLGETGLVAGLETLRQAILFLLTLAALLAFFRRPVEQRGLLSVAFLILAAGTLVNLIVPPANLLVNPGAPVLHAGWERITGLLAYPLLAVATYRQIIDRLYAYTDELKILSQQALQQSRQLSVMMEVSRRIGGLCDWRTVFDQLAEGLSLALNADRCIIGLKDDDGILRPVAAYPSSLFDSARPDGLWLSREALRLPPGSLQNHPEMLVYPITTDEQTVGAILVDNRQSHRLFVPEQEQLCAALVNQVSQAIENAQLYRNLEDEASRMRTILESIEDGIIVANAEGKITLVNAAAERLLATKAVVLLDRPLTAIAPETPLNRRLNLLLEPAGSGHLPPPPTPVNVHDTYLEVDVTPVIAADGSPLGTVVALRNATAQIESAQARSEMIANLTHELRTPLTAIRGYSDMLMSGTAGALNPLQHDFLAVILTHSERMSTLINDITDLFAIETHQMPIRMERLNLAAFLEPIVQTAQGEATCRQLHFSVHLEGNLPLVYCDPARVTQVLEKLLDNAFKYTPADGRVTLRAEPYPSAHFAAYVRVSVSDTGIGIEARAQKHLFTRFFRSENPLSANAGGTGLSLAIAKALVEAQGGQIWVESSPGKGSTFYFTLMVA